MTEGFWASAICGTPEYVRDCCDASLQRLNVDAEDFAPDDYHQRSPRFQGENFAKNLTLADQVRAIATEKGVTASQLALAWLLAQGNDIVPIPGTKHRTYLEENAAAVGITLNPEDLSRIDAVAPKGVAAGDRYPAQTMNTVNR
jgi:aryl-alcohol dehydrogenase-like predicted oxidoreductase